MEINCTKQELQILKKVAAAAEALGMETYLVGGFVRDKILNRPTKDLDLFALGMGLSWLKKLPNILIRFLMLIFLKISERHILLTS